MDAWLILLPAFTVSALMIFTHTYLGLHVLERGIIFIDLALAQVAALGLSIAFLMGHEAHGPDAQLYAFVATLLAALGFAKLRQIPGKIAREVTIGCVYVVATALSIVILSLSSQGMTELKALFNGNILWTNWDEIAIIGAAYAALTVLHVIYRRRFLALSFEPEAAKRPSLMWEFFFFASFAVTITLAVNVAGILLVFAFLIIPGFSASMIARSFPMRLALGWLFGMAGTIAGLWFSFAGDLPTGATVVSALGALPIIAAVMKMALGRRA
ncbi:MAG: metal ABC transporter permease [Sphingomonadales bacterium]